MTMLLAKPDYKIGDVPMNRQASDALVEHPENAAAIILAYFEPTTTSPKRGTDETWRIYGNTMLAVNPGGLVTWIGERERPDGDDGGPGADPLSGRRTRLACPPAGLAPIPAGYGRTRNRGQGGGRGHRGGANHPKSTKDLLRRCRRANLIVQQTQGKHWRISRPDDWPVPVRATTGIVFVSSTSDPNAIAENTVKILRQTGVDVRLIDPRKRYVGAEAVTLVATTAPEPDVVGSDPEPAPAPAPEPVSGPAVVPVPDSPEAVTAPVTGGSTGGANSMGASAVDRPRDSVEERLWFVTEMRREGGHTDAEIAKAMSLTRGGLSAFLSYWRKQGHPLAPPPRKNFTDPRSGKFTQAGATVRMTSRPVSSAPLVSVTGKTKGAVRLDLVSDSDREKVLAELHRVKWLSRKRVTVALGKRGQGERTVAVMSVLASDGSARIQVVPRPDGRAGRPSTYLVDPSVPADQTRPPGWPDQVAAAIEAAAVKSERVGDMVDTYIADTAESDQPETGQADPVAAAFAAFAAAARAGDEFLDRIARDAEAATVEAELALAIEADVERVIAEGAAVIGCLAEREEVIAGGMTEIAALVADRVAEPEPEPEPEPEQSAEEQPEFPDDPPRLRGQRARYATVCAVCDEEIHPGEQIAPIKHKWQHVAHVGQAVAAHEGQRTATAPAEVPSEHASTPPVSQAEGYADRGSAARTEAAVTPPAPMPTVATVLEAALRLAGVDQPERVARVLRFALSEAGWRLKLETGT